MSEKKTDDDRTIPPLVERRENFARKQSSLGKGLFAGRAPRGSGPANRHGMPQLPVGQRRVPNWPVLDLGDHPVISLDEWRLDIDGLVDHPVSLDWKAFMALPQTHDESDFHCVTTWSRMDNHWVGVRFADLMALAQPRASAAYVFVTAQDCDEGSRSTTRRTSRSTTRCNPTCCWFTRGRARRCRSNTAARCA